MQDIIIILIIVVIILLGLRSGLGHFKGQGGCCGGGGDIKKKKKKLDNVIGQKTAVVEGMTCDHCRDRVERSIDDIDGAAGRVNLKKKEAVVLMNRPISDEEIKSAIEKAGYKVTSIS